MARPGEVAGTVPVVAGIGLRAPHLAGIMAARPPLGLLEVHAENYMGGGPAIAALDRVRRDYPISLHGVGLSLGTAGALDRRQLDRLGTLVDRVEPSLVSEHLSWSIADGVYLNHLLPLPYTDETLAVVAEHVAEVQETLGRRLLIENPSSYLRFRHSTLSEAEFLIELVRRTGCGVLCDVNNLFVSAANVALDPGAYLAALAPESVGEIHLAGHARNVTGRATVLIDDHGSPVAEPVWHLYEQAIARFGPVATVVEWDTDLPPLAVLIGEARAADRAIARLEAQHARAA